MRRRTLLRPAAVAALALGIAPGVRAEEPATSSGPAAAQATAAESPAPAPPALPPGPPLVVASLPTSVMPPLPPAAPLGVPPAPARPRSGFRFAIEEDNDGISPFRPRTDEYYTQGLRFSARWSRGVSEDGSESQLGVAIGQEIYTPSNIETTDLNILRHDRPYAGWLYAALLMRTVQGAPGLRLGADEGGPGEGILEIELAAGTTGPPSAAGKLQTWFHELLGRRGLIPRSREPVGWGTYQIRESITLDSTVRYRFDALQASAWLGDVTRRTGSVLGLRLSPRVGLRVGTTHDAASVGLELRTGLLATPVHSPARRRVELWIHGGIDGSFVGYNGFIEGPLRGGATTDVSRVPWVATAQFGAGLRLGFFEIAYRLQWQTPEITPTPEGATRIHRVGRITVAFGGR